MPTYKLTYFNLEVRAETARMLFKLADQPFEDIRIPFAEWPNLKKTFAMGQVPMLEVDGRQIVQSFAINRLLAERFGFAGKTDLGHALVDMSAACVEDLTPRIQPFYDQALQEPEARKAYQERYRKDFLLPTLTNLEKLLKRNNGGDGFFVGDSVTWADLLFVNLSAYVMQTSDSLDALDQFPKLKALKHRVKTLPKIAAWIKERPVPEM